MGWWEEGSGSPEGTDDVRRNWWGDEAADIVDSALYQIQAAFVVEFGRTASKAEILNGLRFSLGKLDDFDKMIVQLPNTPADAVLISAQDRQTVASNYHAAFADPRTPTTLEEYRVAVEAIGGVMKEARKPYAK